MAKIKWYAQTEWVDTETGEIIAIKRRSEYKAIKTETKSEIKEYSNGDKYGIRKHTTECIRNERYNYWKDEKQGQYRLF